MIAVWEFQESVRVLAANPLRSALSILGVVFGVASVVAMLAIGLGAEREIDSILASLGANTLHFSARTVSDDEWLQLVSRTTGLGTREVALVKELHPTASVVAFSHWDVVESNMDLPQPWPKIVGVSASETNATGTSVGLGRWFRASEMAYARPVILVGRSLASRWFPNQESRAIGQWIRLNRVWFKVVGLLGEDLNKSSEATGLALASGSTTETKDLNLTESFLVPMSTGTSRLGALPLLNRFDKLVVALDPATDVIAAKEQLQRIQTLSTPDANAFDLFAAEELIEKKRATSRLFTYFLLVVAMISLVVGGIGIANVMLASMVERIREVGLRRAVGATRRHILAQFVVEALVICFIGGVIGLFLGVAVAALTSFVMGWSFAFSWWGVVFSLLIATLVGLVAGIYPARTASRISPIEALQGRV